MSAGCRPVSATLAIAVGDQAGSTPGKGHDIALNLVATDAYHQRFKPDVVSPLYPVKSVVRFFMIIPEPLPGYVGSPTRSEQIGHLNISVAFNYSEAETVGHPRLVHLRHATAKNIVNREPLRAVRQLQFHAPVECVEYVGRSPARVADFLRRGLSGAKFLTPFVRDTGRLGLLRDFVQNSDKRVEGTLRVRGLPRFKRPTIRVLEIIIIAALGEFGGNQRSAEQVKPVRKILRAEDRATSVEAVGNGLQIRVLTKELLNPLRKKMFSERNRLLRLRHAFNFK